MENVTPKKVKKEKAPKDIIQLAPATLASAIFGFQSEKIVIPKRGKGNIGGRSYTYATLDDVLTSILPALQKNQLIICQPMGNAELTTEIVHVPTNEKMSSSLPLGNPSSSQELGSRITYLRRYQITSMLGLALEEDIDGVQVSADKTPIIPAQQTSAGGQGTPATSGTAKAEAPVVKKQEDIATSPAMQNALNAINSCSNIAAIDEITARIKKSVKLTDEEKDKCMVLTIERLKKLNGDTLNKK